MSYFPDLKDNSKCNFSKFNLKQDTYGKPKIKRTAVLIHCPDKRGIVASVTDFLYKNNGNIIISISM